MGGGHAATIAVRAVKNNLVKAQAIAAVAPTWAGPMPIVFGRSPEMETRFVFLCLVHCADLNFKHSSFIMFRSYDGNFLHVLLLCI